MQRAKSVAMHSRSPEISYAGRLAQERRRFDTVSEFDDLPPIYHYWSNTFVRAMLERLGCRSAPDVSRQVLTRERVAIRGEKPVFLSIGSGDGNNEVEIAQLLQAGGLDDFRIDCLELNPILIKRATEDARGAGLSSHLNFLRGDFNKWRPRRRYDGVVANQSLHHVTNLEGLFDAVRDALAPGAFFVANDVIGRNGHQRWPEARHFVERFWRKLPRSHRFHHQFRRYEDAFTDWDCSAVGLRRNPRARRSPAADRAISLSRLRRLRKRDRSVRRPRARSELRRRGAAGTGRSSIACTRATSARCSPDISRPRT